LKNKNPIKNDKRTKATSNLEEPLGLTSSLRNIRKTPLVDPLLTSKANIRPQDPKTKQKNKKKKKKNPEVQPKLYAARPLLNREPISERLNP